MDNESAIIRLSDLQERGTLKPDSEDALALLFAERYADQLRFVAMWGRWLRYDGVCWSFLTTRCTSSIWSATSVGKPHGCPVNLLP